MPSYTTADIRNVLLAGHGASGKTTLTDALLFASGAVNRKGSISDDSSFSDFEKDEKEHKHSIYPSAFHFSYSGKEINLIDTPGSPDLIGQAITCLPAVETAIIVVNAQNGIEVIARRVMELASEMKLPRAIVVNKIDAPQLDLEALMADMQKMLGPECRAINLPADGGQKVIDCLTNKSGDADFSSVAAAHSAILDQIVEIDEALTEKYLAGEEPTGEDLHKTFIRAINEGHLVPVMFTNARDNVGVKELLDAIVNYLPSPLEGNQREFLSGTNGQDRPIAYSDDVTKPLLAHVFKVTTDPFIGKLAIFRVHQGQATGATQAIIGTTKKAVKLGHVFHLLGKDHREVDALIAGDIGAVAKIEEIHANDVLHNDHAMDSVHLKPMAYPVPMYGLAVAPKARGDEQKISGALAKIGEEDPTFRVIQDRQTHELVVYGLGELHLRLILERLKRRGLEVETKPPKIAYRETITGKADGHYRHKKQTGGAGQFGEVFLRIEPTDRGQGFEFVNEVFGGAIPGQFMPAVEKGVRDLLDIGVIAGYPVQDVRVIITDGKSHPVDSKEVAFRAAGKMAFKDAFLKAKPVLLEPIVNMEVIVPTDKVGIITGDLSGKRGRIQGTDVVSGNLSVVKAQAPLSEVMQYQSHLKSVTGGQGSFSMEFSRYEPVPPMVQQGIAALYKPKAEEE